MRYQVSGLRFQVPICNSHSQSLSLLYCKPGYRFPFIAGGGKSGQQRATHRLMAGPDSDREESATENYRSGE